MDININLNFQPNKVRIKKTLRVFSLVTLMLSIAAAVILFFKLASSEFLLWFYMFYFLIISMSLYIQSKGRHIFDLIGKSYLKLDEYTIEFKKEMMRKKVTKIHWKDIEEVKIKIFEVERSMEIH